jgi:phosphatidylglycerol:prolipoprotein diacylglycerol transferase
VHPVLIDLGFLEIPTYGVLLVTGITCGLLLARLRARSRGLDGDHIFDLGLWVALWGLVGSKVLLVITEPAYVTSVAGFVGLLRAGGVFYGGLIGALLAAIVLFRRYHLPLLPTLDVLAPSVALGHFFGRLGCFAAGCCYGASCHEPWAVTFSDLKAHQISGTPLGVPLHPTQLYEAAFNLANYGLLAWIFKRQPRAGTVIGAYLVVYGAGRFCIELLRGDPDRGFLLGGMVSTSQAIALVMIPLGIAVWVWAWRKKAGDGEQGTGKKQ